MTAVPSLSAIFVDDSSHYVQMIGLVRSIPFQLIVAAEGGASNNDGSLNKKLLSTFPFNIALRL